MSNYSEFALIVEGIPFKGKCWEHSNDVCDVEVYGQAESQYLYYPGSSLIDVELNAVLRTSHIIEDVRQLIENKLPTI
jgi:hypothetical protein